MGSGWGTGHGDSWIWAVSFVMSFTVERRKMDVGFGSVRSERT